MSRYRFHAKDLTGQPATGLREADSPSHLIATLVREGHTDIVVRLDEPSPLFSSSRLSEEDTRELAQQIAGLTRAGMPLHTGLKALSDDLPAGNLRNVIAELSHRLESGEPLDEALETLGHRFPGHLRDLILAGVHSGHVGEVLSQFVDYARVGAEVKRSVWSTLLYPLVLVTLFLFLFFLICMFLVRQFESIFLDFGIDFPLITRVLLSISRLVTGAGWSLLITPLVALALGYFAFYYLLDAPSRRRLTYAIPILGPLWKWTSLAEYSHYLAMLLECQIPLTQAVHLAAEGTGDALLQSTSQEVATRLEAGEPLDEAVATVRALPSAFRKLLHWAEGYQSLPETLHMIGDMFEAQARSRANFAGSAIGLFTILFVLWGVAFLVIGLFLPLITLISRLSG